MKKILSTIITLSLFVFNTAILAKDAVKSQVAKKPGGETTQEGKKGTACICQ